MIKVLSWNIRQGGGSRVSKILSKLRTLLPQVIVLSEFRNNDHGIKLRHALLSVGYRYQGVTHAKASDNSVAIFSLLPGDIRLFLHSDPIYSANVIAIEYEAFTLYGMYLPHKKKHTLFDLLLEEVQKEKPSILVGDFNTGKNYIDQKGNSFWYEDKLIQLEALGCLDAFSQGNGYRYDHTYISDDLVAITKDCYYLHEWREEKLSDHSPMVIELGV